MNWQDIYRIVQRAEAESCLGGWVASTRPAMGPLIQQAFELTRTLDRSILPRVLTVREEYARRMNAFLAPRDLICIPTVATPAPLRGSVRQRNSLRPGITSNPQPDVDCGSRPVPQVSLPLAVVSGVPVGLSLIGEARGQLFAVCGFGNRRPTRSLTEAACPVQH